jgi:hypothetical protein
MVAAPASFCTFSAISVPAQYAAPALPPFNLNLIANKLHPRAGLIWHNPCQLAQTVKSLLARNIKIVSGRLTAEGGSD